MYKLRIMEKINGINCRISKIGKQGGTNLYLISFHDSEFYEKGENENEAIKKLEKKLYDYTAQLELEEFKKNKGYVIKNISINYDVINQWDFGANSNIFHIFEHWGKQVSISGKAYFEIEFHNGEKVSKLIEGRIFDKMQIILDEDGKFKYFNKNDIGKNSEI